MNITSKSLNTGVSARGATAWLIRVMPVIKMAKPTRTLPASFFLPSLPVMSIITPTRATRGEKDSGLSICSQKLSLSMPVALNIQAVRVVPMLEPMMTLTVWLSSIMPELTRPTSITVMAEEDWMAMVITAPRARPFQGLEVIERRMDSSLPPTIFSSPAESTCIPYKKNARPPKRLKIEKMSMF